ncbi:MAG: hypothetical protein Kow0029_11360 [Candidatus Rifleibacteriota bacterium]
MLYFENLYISEEVKDLAFVKNIQNSILFDKLHFVTGEKHPGNGLLLTKNRGAFIKPCPGQKGSVCCGYWVVEWGLGCPFACEYCILQNYTGAGDVTLFVNLEDCKNEIIDLRNRLKGPIRLGTGQFGDPMALEQIFPLNEKIIDWTRNFKDFKLEIKTKSDYIQPVLDNAPAKHVIMAFSLNPQTLIDRLEHGAASLEARLNAARQVAREADCSLAFHFDPILPLNDWKNEYRKVFDLMHEKLQGLRIDWISLGTFRFPKGFPDLVEKFHPESPILLEEFYPSEDGKLRYFRPFREEIYKFAMGSLKKAFPDTAIYICMETKHVWERLCEHEFNSSDLKNILDSRL